MGSRDFWLMLGSSSLCTLDLYLTDFRVGFWQARRWRNQAPEENLVAHTELKHTGLKRDILPLSPD